MSLLNLYCTDVSNVNSHIQKIDLTLSATLILPSLPLPQYQTVSFRSKRCQLGMWILQLIPWRFWSMITGARDLQRSAIIPASTLVTPTCAPATLDTHSCRMPAPVCQVGSAPLWVLMSQYQKNNLFACFILCIDFVLHVLIFLD